MSLTSKLVFPNFKTIQAVGEADVGRAVIAGRRIVVDGMLFVHYAGKMFVLGDTQVINTEPEPEEEQKCDT